jgi:1-deoxy-D-xylulose-5-phosphate synthase
MHQSSRGSIFQATDPLKWIRSADISDMESIAKDIRSFLIEKVSKSGGHLGPNLGVVELTIALHRVFESPRDRFVFDTGHQTYVHKILTGRAADFDTLRTKDGLSGYPSRNESVHDIVENSHASTALSWAEGIARGYVLKGGVQRHVVAVVGDGSLTGGMAWEALNSIAVKEDLPLVIVVNDNSRSYSPTVGGLAKYLASLRSTRSYENFLSWGKRFLLRVPVVGQPIFGGLHGLKKGLKDIFAPQGMFEDLGLKYIGPINGHDVGEIEIALEQAKKFKFPVLVHVITEKGHGYRPALDDSAERFHAVGKVDPETGLPLRKRDRSWTDAFEDAIVELGRRNRDVVTITAAMLGPTGLTKFQSEFPDRTFDVGIAEQHAITSASGMAFAGLKPVVAIYSTFLNRGFDQLLMDAALHSAPITLVLDRSGITGEDGPSHHGVWDMSLATIVPQCKLFSPRDENRLNEALEQSLTFASGPNIVRFNKGAITAEIKAHERVGSFDLLHVSSSKDVLVISIGSMAQVAMESIARINVGVTVVDPLWILPIQDDLLDYCRDFGLVVVIEDGVTKTGIASAIRNSLSERGALTPVRGIGVKQEFIEHASRNQIMHDLNLDSAGVADQINQWWKVMEDSPLPWDGIANQ